MAGCFACAFVAMVESGEADVKPWYSATTPELWRECHFARMPSYKTVQRTFKDLEEIRHVFAEALRRLVQHARKREPRIGHAVAVDATMAESNARPHKLATSDGSLPDRIGKLPLLASSRMPTETVNEIRRAANSAPPDAGPIQVGEYIDITPMIASDVRDQYRIFTLKSGTYISRDIQAGMCAYTRGGKLLKWWYGYLLTQGIDHFSGLPLEAHGFAADQTEFKHYETVVEKAIDTLGRTPFFVSADKGMSYTDCFEWSVERGMTLVAPYRKANGVAPDKAQPTVHFDQHGVPFCRGCGGGTDQVGFHVEEAKGVKGKPRPLLLVRCAAPQTEKCVGPQEWNCRVDPTRLLPVWRTHPAYSAVRKRHQQFERAHNEARTRANAKPRHFETRTKRVSLDLAIMRMNVYALIAWLRASVINGWLGTPALNPELERLAAKQRWLDTNTQATFTNHMVIVARLRRGLVGGGRVPHRNRGGPTRAAPTPGAPASS
jgi:DDE family transposase